MANLTIQDRAAEKKVLSVSAHDFSHSDITANGVDHSLFMLPESVLVTSLKVITTTAPNSATTFTIKIGTVNKAIDVSAIGVDTEVLDINTTGETKVTLSHGNAGLTAGNFVVILYYTEYKRGNGELTSYDV